jgi:hypothetical protein
MSTVYRVRSYSSPSIKTVSTITRDVTRELNFYKVNSNKSIHDKLKIKKLKQIKNIEHIIDSQVDKKLTMLNYYGDNYESKYDYFNCISSMNSRYSIYESNNSSSDRVSLTSNYLSSKSVSETSSDAYSLNKDTLSDGVSTYNASESDGDKQNITLSSIYEKNKNDIKEYILETYNIIDIITCYLSYMKDAHSVYQKNSRESNIALERASCIYELVYSNNKLYQEWRNHLFEEIEKFIKNNVLNVYMSETI